MPDRRRSTVTGEVAHGMPHEPPGRLRGVASGARARRRPRTTLGRRPSTPSRRRIRRGGLLDTGPGSVMTTRQTLTLGHERFRVGPWHADPATAYLSLTPDVPRPSSDGLLRCLRRLVADGYGSVITAALHPEEARPFLELGFTEHDRLLVLSHPLRDLEPPRPAPASRLVLRRGRRSDRRAALELDARAFPDNWRIDEDGLAEARNATPRSRFEVAELDRRLAGYAVTGRSGAQAFLQRLATDPSQSGRGVASALVVDAMRWAARRGARRLLVNTQESNLRALQLYERLGFDATDTDLVVLARPIP